MPKNKRTIISIGISIIVTALIFLSPFSLWDSMFHCYCGGCSVGCPGDCNTTGMFFAYHYWGVNKLSGEVVDQVNMNALIMNVFIWGILMFIIYRFIYKKYFIIFILGSILQIF